MRSPWEQYFSLAEELAARTDSEAAMRSAISRAYYAAFNIAQRHRGARNAAHARGGPHQAVWIELTHSGNPAWRRAGNKGRQLIEVRHAADYAAEFPNLKLVMGGALSAAAEILQLLNS